MQTSADGHHHLVGFDVVDAESYPGWLAFLRSLKAHGVDGVICVTSDAHAGLPVPPEMRRFANELSKLNQPSSQ